jgi:hypothetical protein
VDIDTKTTRPRVKPLTCDANKHVQTTVQLWAIILKTLSINGLAIPLLHNAIALNAANVNEQFLGRPLYAEKASSLALGPLECTHSSGPNQGNDNTGFCYAQKCFCIQR